MNAWPTSIGSGLQIRLTGCDSQSVLHFRAVSDRRQHGELAPHRRRSVTVTVHHGELAHSVEHGDGIAGAAGAKPALSTNFALEVLIDTCESSKLEYPERYRTGAPLGYEPDARQEFRAIQQRPRSQGCL